MPGAAHATGPAAEDYGVTAEFTETAIDYLQSDPLAAKCYQQTVKGSWMNTFEDALVDYEASLYWCVTTTSSTKFISYMSGSCRGFVHRPAWKYHGCQEIREDTDTARAFYESQGHFSLDAFGLTWQTWDPWVSIVGNLDGTASVSYQWT